MIVEAVVAFVGGILSLLSPCSALLLPDFFAYAFASPGRLVLRTAIFYLGLLTLFVPLGLGVGAISSLVLEHRGAVTLVAGLLLVAIGVYQLAVGGFELPGARALQGRVSGESAAATYTLGLVYGIGGFCSGPILGGVLTLASTRAARCRVRSSSRSSPSAWPPRCSRSPSSGSVSGRPVGPGCADARSRLDRCAAT